MDVERFADEVFKIDVGIRYVGIVDAQYRVLVSKMRAGIGSLTSARAERDFVSIMPPIIVDAVEKLEPHLGTVESVSIRYEKALLLFQRVNELVLVMSFGPEVVTPFLSRISSETKKLADKAR
jgi:hypothetical protein